MGALGVELNVDQAALVVSSQLDRNEVQFTRKIPPKVSSFCCDGCRGGLVTGDRISTLRVWRHLHRRYAPTAPTPLN
jgi:hypothetical protein